MQQIGNSQQTCSYTQQCPGYVDPSLCYVPIGKFFEPEVYDYTNAPMMCPDLMANGSATCCNSYQNWQLFESFVLIDFAFGTASGSGLGGCDICSANLKRFWCYFTCSPRQKEFVSTHGVIWWPNPSNTTQLVQVQNTTLVVHPDLACQLFASCNKTQYVTQVAAMQTAVGFLTFQGQNDAGPGGMLIQVIFNDTATALNLDLDPCNKTYNSNVTKDGYPFQQNCSCNNCDNSCKGYDVTKFIKIPHAMQGCNWKLIAIFFSCVIFEAITVFIYRKFKYNHKEMKNNNSNKQLKLT